MNVVHGVVVSAIKSVRVNMGRVACAFANQRKVVDSQGYPGVGAAPPWWAPLTTEERPIQREWACVDLVWTSCQPWNTRVRPVKRMEGYWWASRWSAT